MTGLSYKAVRNRFALTQRVEDRIACREFMQEWGLSHWKTVKPVAFCQTSPVFQYI
jgi:hypothetical protein